jgi:hypothetical protein
MRHAIRSPKQHSRTSASLDVALPSFGLHSVHTRLNRSSRPKQVIQIFGQTHVLLSSTVLKDGLASWGKGAKLCNMHVERLLSQVKRSAPGKCPELERYISAGTLTQWHRGHNNSGGTDMTRTRTRDLLAAGAPLRAGVARSSRLKNPKMQRPHIRYANEEVAREKRRRKVHGLVASVLCAPCSVLLVVSCVACGALRAVRCVLRVA